MGGIRRIGALALAVTLGFGLTGCGDDDESAEEGTTTEAPGSEDGGDDTTGGDDISELLGGEDCADFYQAFSEAGEASANAFNGDAEDLEEAAAYFSEVADNLPDEIADDFEVFASAYADFAQALADADIDLSDPSNVDPEALAQLEPIMEAMGSAEVQEASNNIQAYMAENCSG